MAGPSHWKPLADQIFNTQAEGNFSDDKIHATGRAEPGPRWPRLLEFEIDDGGEVATISGVEVEIVRLSDDDGARLQLQLGFPGGEKFIVYLSRNQTLETAEYWVGES